MKTALKHMTDKLYRNTCESLQRIESTWCINVSGKKNGPNILSHQEALMTSMDDGFCLWKRIVLVDANGLHVASSLCFTAALANFEAQVNRKVVIIQ